MQEEVDQKTIALAVKTGKLTAQVLQAAIRKYLAARQKGTGKAHHGQQSLRQLKKDGSALSNIEITDANIGLFKPCAKKYDIDFTLRKDRTTHPPRYIVIFKSKQADNLEQAFKEFTAKKLKQQERPLHPKGPCRPERKGSGQKQPAGQGENQGKGAVTMKPEMKKLIIANLPYLLFVYLFGKLGQTYRLAAGADLSEKLLHLADGFSLAFESAAPSFHLFDLAGGGGGGGGGVRGGV